MLHYGLEYEFFVKEIESGKIVPALHATYNLDGNPVLGEIRTKIHTSLVDAVFELDKLLFLEKKALNQKGFDIETVNYHKFSVEERRAMRKDRSFVARKDFEVLEEFSIYDGGQLGNMLDSGEHKASLQINFSDNSEIVYRYPSKNGDVTETFKKDVSNVFNYIPYIKAWDLMFAAEIEAAGRVPGVYAIKSGELGNRIEYRSLPNDIVISKLID